MRKTLLGSSLTLMLVMLMAIASAAPALAAPVWRLDANTNSSARPGGSVAFHMQISNVGEDPADGTGGDPIVFTASLPDGLTADSVTFVTIFGTLDWSILPGWACSGDGPGPAPGIVGAQTVTCDITDTIAARDMRTAAFGLPAQPIVTAAVDGGAGGRTLTTGFSVSGGGAAAPATTAEATRITDDPPAFGVDSFDSQVTKDATGAPLTQAGAHPYDASVTLDFNTSTSANPLLGDIWPVAAPKDVFVDLPPGFVGDPTVAAQCTNAQLSGRAETSFAPSCPPAAQIGTVTLRLNGLGSASNIAGPQALFNLVPPPNAPARFGFNVQGSVVTFTAQLRTGGDYGITMKAADISEGLAVSGTTITIWGVPASDDHTPERECQDLVARQYVLVDEPTCQNGGDKVPFLRNPTSCPSDGSGLPISMRMDSWKEPGNFVSDSIRTHYNPGYPFARDEWGPEQGTTGCDRVPFDPTLRVTPGTPARAGAPTGFSFDLSIPQVKNPITPTSPDVPSQADLRTATVTLPEGVRVNPSAANGLGACSPAQIGLVGTRFPVSKPIHFNEDAPTCPDASKIGDVKIVTPLLADPLEGSVYLASQGSNPFGSLLALYLVVKGPGFYIKLPGQVTANSSTGQLTTTFDENPQLPFSDLTLTLSGGPNATLAMPSACGTYRSHTVFDGWNGRTVESESSFDISQNSNGEACKPAGFSPSLSAGTRNPAAGVFTPFGLQLMRSDTDQEFKTLRSLSLPPGLLADVGSVSVRCTEDQARAAACPVGSHIGTVLTGAGAGPDPFYVPGDVYLMGQFANGPFKGDPFGLAIVVHAKAGPFDLGYVVVESGIQIHNDGSITAQTEPFPTILQGIPLQLKDIRFNLDRPHFIVNPTNCAPMSVNGTVDSTSGQTAGLSSRFQAGECANLAFKPSFKATVAKDSTFSGQGAGFTVKIATNGGPGGGEANIAKVNVRLPKILPSRLETLQKACTEKVFAANPAACPAESKVGTAVAKTPLLASPLSGPAILVSHGGAGFPDLVLVLQGEGVTIELTGKTEIKGGYTFSRFDTVPDAPVSSFQLSLPRGRYSALAANGNMCKQRKKLTMPTTIIAQNGAVIKETTKIAVPHCAKAKKHSRRHKKNRRK